MVSFRKRDGSGLVQYRWVVEDTDRAGNVRLYFRRRPLPKIRLHATPGTDAFDAEYKAALEGRAASPRKRAAAPQAGTMAALCRLYMASPEFKQLQVSTQRQKRAVLDAFCDAEGEKPFDLMEAKNVRARRDAKSDTPEAANRLVKTLRQVFAWAIEAGHASRNPARDVKLFRSNSEGHHSWSHEEIALFLERHPVGTSACLALFLGLYTAQRLEDVVGFGRQHVRTVIEDGKEERWLFFTQAKNQKRKPKHLKLLIAPPLQRVIDASPVGDLTFIVNHFGRPFSKGGFGNRFRKWCDEAGLRHCSFHGLRKASAARMSDLFFTEQQTMAVTGHDTSKELARYTRGANQARLAKGVLGQLTFGTKLEQEVPLSGAVEPSGTNLPSNALKGKAS